MKNVWMVTKVLFLRMRFIFLFIVIGLIVGNWQLIRNHADRLVGPPKAAVSAKGEYEYFCPMHPSVVRDEPGNCPICGMPLSQRKRGEPTPLPEKVLSRVQLSEQRIQQAGLATEPVAYRTLTREVRTVGAIEADERRTYEVTAKVPGRIEKFYRNFTGQEIKAGEAYAALYSPDLLATQEDYLRALRSGDEPSKRLLEGARKRLQLWGITNDQIAALEKEGKASAHVDIVSPYGGTIMTRSALLGHWLEVGTVVYRVADLSAVWMNAEVFERDISLVEPGQVMEITAESYPGRFFQGTVTFVQPTVQTETRTVKVRVDIDNQDLRLKPGMYVTAVLRIPLGRRGEVYYGRCPSCGEMRRDAPGKCEICGMTPVKRGGVEGAPPAQVVYVCPHHPEVTGDKPGNCDKCGKMDLKKITIPADARLVYVCPDHPELRSDKPGVCEKDGKPLQHKVISGATRAVDAWVCPVHPERTSGEKSKCPECRTEMKRHEYEQTLAVPFSAVIDTGTRKVVFLDIGDGSYDMVEIKVGPRAGEYYAVAEGLKAGDTVVTAGAFLLDAEARLNPAARAAYFGASGQATPPGHTGH